MILHAQKCICHSLPPLYWRGLRSVMQLHEKRHMKRAGEAGRVLRTSGIELLSKWTSSSHRGDGGVTPYS
ncbi:hypothetical protein CLM71_00430 [Serratia sp. MYb239]|nr:hypothetical protein CLM71_00430 [Serratia sp. MYb239]